MFWSGGWSTIHRFGAEYKSSSSRSTSLSLQLLAREGQRGKWRIFREVAQVAQVAQVEEKCWRWWRSAFWDLRPISWFCWLCLRRSGLLLLMLTLMLRLKQTLGKFRRMLLVFNKAIKEMRSTTIVTQLIKPFVTRVCLKIHKTISCEDYMLIPKWYSSGTAMDMDIGLDTVMRGHIITLSLTARLGCHNEILGNIWRLETFAKEMTFSQI